MRCGDSLHLVASFISFDVEDSLGHAQQHRSSLASAYLHWHLILMLSLLPGCTQTLEVYHMKDPGISKTCCHANRNVRYPWQFMPHIVAHDPCIPCIPCATLRIDQAQKSLFLAYLCLCPCRVSTDSRVNSHANKQALARHGAYCQCPGILSDLQPDLDIG